VDGPGPDKKDGGNLSRPVPVRFEMAPVVKKADHLGTEAGRNVYRRQKKEKNPSVQFVALAQKMHQQLNRRGS
jgi:hypothetical protein